MSRLENGLEKLASTSCQVDALKEKLAVQEIELQQKNEAADKLIEMVGVETAKVQSEKALGKNLFAQYLLVFFPLPLYLVACVCKKTQDLRTQDSFENYCFFLLFRNRITFSALILYFLCCVNFT